MSKVIQVCSKFRVSEWKVKQVCSEFRATVSKVIRVGSKFRATVSTGLLRIYGNSVKGNTGVLKI